MSLDVRIKRVYDPAEPSDGYRVLTDRIWPRGVSRERAKLDVWARELAPSNELRRWFGHDPARFAEFRARYRNELTAHHEQIEQLRAHARRGPVTIVYAALTRGTTMPSCSPRWSATCERQSSPARVGSGPTRSGRGARRASGNGEPPVPLSGWKQPTGPPRARRVRRTGCCRTGPRPAPRTAVRQPRGTGFVAG